MSWFFVDDGFPDHPKLALVPPRRLMAAVGLWTLAGAWSRKKLTGGEVPEGQVKRLGGTAQQAEDLCTAGLWERRGSTFHFHNWAAWQETPDEVASKRARWKSEKQAWRKTKGKSKMSSPDKQRTSNGLSGVSAPCPQPVPGIPSPSPSPSPRERETLVQTTPSELRARTREGGGSPLSSASGGHTQEVTEGWAEAYQAASAGTAPVLGGQTLATAVEFARRVALAHGKELRQAARDIATAALAQCTRPSDRVFELSRLDPYAGAPNAGGLPSTVPELRELGVKAVIARDMDLVRKVNARVAEVERLEERGQRGRRA